MSLCLLSVHMNGVVKSLKMVKGRMGLKISEDGRKLRCVNGSFVNARSVQLDYSMVLYQSVFKCMGVKQLV